MENLSKLAKQYIGAVLVVGGLLTIWQLARLDFDQLALLVITTALASILQIMKIEGPTSTSSFNLSWIVYGASFPLLGVPETVLVIVLSHCVEWIWFRYPWYIQSFNIAAFVITASITGLFYEFSTDLWPVGSVSIILIFSGNLVFTVVNHWLVGTVIRLARGQSMAQSGVFTHTTLLTDLGLLCLGTTVALISTVNPVAILFVAIIVYLLHSVLQVPALKRQSEIEPKTGLFNVEYFNGALQRELAQTKRLGHPLTVVMADLDELREINNAYGHLAGDAVIKKIARILQASAREDDTVARFGGEEFAILMPDVKPAQAYVHIEAMRKAVEAAEFTVLSSATPIKATISFGIAGNSGSDQPAEELIHDADLAVYNAKREGRNRTCVYGEESPSTMLTTENGMSPLPEVPRPAELAAGRNGESASPGSAEALAPPPRLTDDVDAASGRAEPTAFPPRPVNAKAINLYIAGVAFTALALLLLLLRPIPGMDWAGVLVFIALAVAAEAVATDLYGRDTSVSTSVAPLIAATMIFGAAGAALTSVAITIVAQIKHRAAIDRLVFNTSNHLIATLLCAGLIALLGKPFVEWPLLVQIILVLLSALLVYLSTTFLISGAVSLSKGESAKDVWQSRFQWLAPHYISLGAVAYALIFGFAAMGEIGVLVLLAPLLMLHFSQRQYITATEKILKQLRDTNEQLHEQSEAVRKLNEELFLALAGTIDLRDPDVMQHSINVARYAVLTAEELGLPADRIELVRRAGLMHDIGKLAIPEAILFKPARLTVDEHEIVSDHTTIGSDLLAEFPTLRNIARFVRHHHERYDGSGYPDALPSDRIPLESRILALSDAVEAMASDRPYRRGLPVADILEEILNHSGTQFDPAVVQAFRRVVTKQGDSIIINSARHLYDEHLEGWMQRNGATLAPAR